MNLTIKINCYNKFNDKLYDFALDIYKELRERHIPLISMETSINNDLSSNKE